MPSTALVDSNVIDGELDLVIGEIERDITAPRDAEPTTCTRIYCGF